MVYNTLAGDLLRAGEACRQRDISGRCTASNRALLLLGHLEAWASGLDDRLLIDSLRTFYQSLRREIIRLQAHGSPADFDRLSEAVQGVRGAWQEKEQASTHAQWSREGVPHPRLDTFEARFEEPASAWCA